MTEMIEVINPDTTPNEEMNKASTPHSSPVPSPTPNSNARNGNRNGRRTRSGRQVRMSKQFQANLNTVKVKFSCINDMYLNSLQWDTQTDTMKSFSPNITKGNDTVTN